MQCQKTGDRCTVLILSAHSQSLPKLHGHSHWAAEKTPGRKSVGQKRALSHETGGTRLHAAQVAQQGVLPGHVRGLGEVVHALVRVVARRELRRGEAHSLPPEVPVRPAVGVVLHKV